MTLYVLLGPECYEGSKELLVQENSNTDLPMVLDSEARLSSLPGAFASLCSLLEDALTSPTKHDLEQISARLIMRMRWELRLTSREVRQGILEHQAEKGSGELDPIWEAYCLGQLSFAQTLASQAVNRRADDDFVPKLRQRVYAKCIHALCEKDMTLDELSVRTKERRETAHQKMRHLIALGAVDFRKAGSECTYFLTPAALSCMKTQK